MDLDFDGVIAWLDRRVGRSVFASTQGGSQDAGNTRMSIPGELRRAEGEIVLMDPRPGRIEVFAVGDATLVLLEGDFLSAQVADLGEDFPALLQAAFRDMLVVFGEVSGNDPRLNPPIL